MIAATRTYWTEWRTSLASGNWLKAFGNLIDELDGRLNRTIKLVDLGDVKAKVVDGRPHVDGLIQSDLVR